MQRDYTNPAEENVPLSLDIMQYLSNPNRYSRIHGKENMLLSQDTVQNSSISRWTLEHMVKAMMKSMKL